jgi:hypothetical protein
MPEQKSPEGVQHWSVEPYIDPRLADGPPAGALIDNEAVCRGCITAAEENAMRRGFVDPISAKAAAEQVHVCVRCGNRILVGA